MFCVERMCKVLAVSRSGYYSWLNRTISERTKKDNNLKKQILAIYHQSKKRYGSPRIHRQLANDGVRLGKKRVERLMRELDIQGIQKRKHRCTTTSKHQLPVAENILDRRFYPDTLDQVWASDITYIPTHEGWLYLAAVMDLYSRKIVGWSMDRYLKQELVIQALRMALSSRNPTPGLILHSDRGSQYAGSQMQHLMAQHGIKSSMSRKGNCWDNAVMESFFGTLKTELVYRNTYQLRSQAKRSVFEYIEVFYNRMRLHSALDYNTPEEYESMRKSA